MVSIEQGKTQSMLAVIAWAYSFGTNDSVFIFINKDGGNAKENLQRLKDQIDALPEYLHFDQILEEDEQTGKMRITKAVKNATSMRHPITKNRIVIKSKATSYESALSLARGLTAPVLSFDEPEFTNHIKTIVSNSVSTYETAARNARKNGALFGRIFTCTPGDLDTACGQEAQEILADTCKWTEKMYDKEFDIKDTNCELYQYVRNNGSNGIVYIEYSYKQIGLTDEWLHNIANKIQDPITVKREILLQRLRGSSDSPFDQEDLDYIISSAHNPIQEEFILDHFRLDIYDPLRKNIPYLVGVDCSTGTNSDNNAVTIINPYTERPVAEFQCPYIGETMFEKFLIELVQKHIPRAIVIIERNSVGDGIVDHLMASPINHRLYFDKNKDLLSGNLTDAGTVESMLKRHGQQKKYYGVYTEGNSRESMMAILFRRVHEYKDDFVTKNITEDIAHLVRSSSGKILAVAPFHDDSIMSYLIAMYVFYHGNNLAAFGFIKGSQEIENQNEGLYVPAESLRGSGIVPDELLDMQIQHEKVQKEFNYSEMMYEALRKSQQDSLELSSRGLVRNETYENTPSVVLEDMYDEGSVPMSFFDEMNDF